MSDLFSIEVNERPFFLARGKLRIKEIESIDLSQVLSSLILTDKIIRESYRRHVIENMKLIGQEKAHLIEKMTDMIIYVVTLRLYFEKKVFNQTIAEAMHPDLGFEMKIYLTRQEFTINGYYSRDIFEKLPGFHYWEEMHFWPLYDKLLQTIRMVVEDGKITDEEGRMVTLLLDEMLHLLIIIYYKLESEFVLS